MPHHGTSQQIVYRNAYREARERGYSQEKADNYAKRMSGQEPRGGERRNDPCGGCPDIKLRFSDQRTREANELDIDMVARKLGDEALRGAFKSGGKIPLGSVSKGIKKLFETHRHEFSPSEQRQMKQIVDSAVDYVERGLERIEREMREEPNEYDVLFRQSVDVNNNNRGPDVVHTETTFWQRLTGRK